MGVGFAIDRWAATAPGLSTPAQWREWAAAPWLPQGSLAADAGGMPALQRRRLNELGRAAVQVAWDCHEPEAQVPLVFASGYGDAQRCLRLLHAHAVEGSMSPTDFTLSVHNAIGAMYAIARQDTAPSTSVAAGPASAALGLVEAVGLLADGAGAVLLVCYEAPLPDAYAGFSHDVPAAYAWAWSVTACRPGEPHFELTWTDAPEPDAPAAPLPFGLQTLAFSLSDAPSVSLSAGGRRWVWSRHA